MAVRFTVHTDGMESIKAKLAQGCSKAEHVLAVQVMKDTNPFVPMRSSSLRQRTRVDGNLVIYPGPYARYLYYGKLYVDPLTGSPFARKDVTKVKAQPERDLKFYEPRTCSHWFEASKAQNLEKWLRVADKAVKHEL